MELRFLLNGIEINEPIGFDGFKPVIERTDHHGMSVSVSLSKIGFYGKALEIIDDAYNTDIDTELPFIVEINRDGDWVNIYSGVIDLASYERVSENGACQINCNVGEIGVKTTFNNRYDTKVELNREKSLDDDSLAEYPMLKNEITFPSKEIMLTVDAGIDKDVDEVVFDDTNFGGFGNRWFYIPLGETKKNEFERLNSESTAFRVESLGYGQIHPDGFLPNRVTDEDCCFVFTEENSKMKSPQKFNIKIQIKFEFTSFYFYYPYCSYTVLVYHCNSDGSTKALLKIENLDVNDSNFMNSNDIFSVDTSFDNSGEPLLMEYGEKIAVLFYTSEADNYFYMKYFAKAGSGISITALTQSDPTQSNVSLVHESLSRLSEIAIGKLPNSDHGLTVKSEWYGRVNSNVNPENNMGGGALKAILNGYELRNADLTSGERPPVKLSFKDLFESLNAIDNIGWGFWEEKEGEENILYLRIERWQWFYKDYEIMRINNPNNVKRTIQADKVYTGLKIGYEKYLDEQEINAIDTFHTNREYYTGLKAIDNKLEKICKFIADPYTIEMTRRQQFNKDTSNWKYDEDIFIVALYFPFHIAGKYSPFLIDIGITDTEDGDNKATIISPETMYNMRISPQRNAIRLAERFFEVKSNKNSLDYTAGTGNVTAKGKPVEKIPAFGINYYLEDSSAMVAISERDNISRKAPILKPEILSFDYPITFEQYAAILANPYGKITVDGEECYIQKVTPTLVGNIASFELIPKNV